MYFHEVCFATERCRPTEFFHKSWYWHHATTRTHFFIMSKKCHACGKSIYPMDKSTQINEDMVFHNGCFKCKASGASLTMQNHVVQDGEVYHPNSRPDVAPTGDAGLSITQQHLLDSQAVASSHHTAGGGYKEGEGGGSSYSHIPDHISAATTGMSKPAGI